MLTRLLLRGHRGCRSKGTNRTVCTRLSFNHTCSAIKERTGTPTGEPLQVECEQAGVFTTTEDDDDEVNGGQNAVIISFKLNSESTPRAYDPGEEFSSVNLSTKDDDAMSGKNEIS